MHTLSKESDLLLSLQNLYFRSAQATALDEFQSDRAFSHLTALTDDATHETFNLWNESYQDGSVCNIEARMKRSQDERQTVRI